VFTSERPSAPAFWTARAVAGRSVAAGESFAKRGFPVCGRAAATSSAALSGASSTFGQDRLSSIASTSSSALHVSELGVVVRREAADGHPQRNSELGQTRKLVVEQAVDPGVLEPDRVEHARLGLGDPDRTVALARLWRDGLRHEDVERAGDFGRLERVQAARRVQDHAASRTGPATQSLCSTPSISTEQP
jgi:hypothetical protein